MKPLATITPLTERLREGPYVQDGTLTRATMLEAAELIETLTARLHSACNAAAHQAAHAHRRIRSLESALQQEADLAQTLRDVLLARNFASSDGPLTLRVHAVVDQMPDADTDVLIFEAGDTEAQLGAYVGHDDDGPIWVDAQGERVATVTHWAELPCLVPAGKAAAMTAGLFPDAVAAA